MKLLNLGCGTVTSSLPGVVNIDRSMYLRLKKNRLAAPIVPLVVRGERRKKFDSLPDNIMMHDLAKGIPFDDGSVDAVYHSHMLPHLDRDVAEDLLREVYRVLKPGGIQRIVVPDLELRCRDYMGHLAACDADPAEDRDHEAYVATLFEMSVRKEAFGTAMQKPLRRFVENLVLGDARARGETVQWMYDRINLRVKLLDAGFSRVEVHEFTTSLIEGWTKYGLDTDEHGNQAKRGSLYIEGVK